MHYKSLTTDGKPIAPVSDNLLSEYAREDIGRPQLCLEIFKNSWQGLRDIHQISEGTMKSDDCVDRWPFFRVRELFYGQCASISVDRSRCNGPHNSFAETGDANGPHNSFAETGDAMFLDFLAAPSLRTSPGCLVHRVRRPRTPESVALS